MTPDAAVELVGFAYGEELEGSPPRSLGYRLLTPAESTAWCAEVEALARRLQAAPYPDHWPASDLFCSVLLADGRRLVAVARYGLIDHTPGGRRGGLELIGVLAPAGLDVAAALAIHAWLRQRRAADDDLRHLDGAFALGEVLAAAPAPAIKPGPVPVLPVRLWQEGALLFAASTPADPDHHLRLLEQEAGTDWQWLPLVGADFPLHHYAQRGPLLAWTPHLAGVAIQLDRRADVSPPTHRPRSRSIGTAVLAVLLLGLLAGNLVALLTLHQRLNAARPAPPQAAPVAPPTPTPVPAGPETAGRERLVHGLYRLLTEGTAGREWEAERQQLLARYERLARTRPDLRVADDNRQGKLAVGAISVLADRGAGHIEDVVRQALENKGFSDKLIRAACEHVREEFAAEVRKGP